MPGDTRPYVVPGRPTGPRTTSPQPPAPVPRSWLVRFTLAWLGLWMAYLVPSQLTLPDQLDRLDHSGRIGDYAVINAVAGVAALVTLPLFGALCDRTRTRFGRRRTWMAAGLGVFAAGLAATGAQTTATGVGAAWLVATLGFNMATVGFTAAVADQVPEAQRGKVSTAIYGPQAVGLVLGLAALSSFRDTPLRYAALAIGVVAFGWPFVRRTRDTAPPAPDAAAPCAGTGPPRPAAGRRPASAPRPYGTRRTNEFAWAFGSRLLINLANVLTNSYLLFFIKDGLKAADPDRALLALTSVYLAFTLLATYGGSALSDRTGRRRVFVAGAAAAQATACLVLALVPAFGAAFLAAALLGAGYGAYMAVDQVVIMQVLPEERDRAKDLGIMNIGAFVPSSLGPLAAGALISASGGYRLLFVVAAVVSVLGAAAVSRITSVR
ncbi:MFS transporter [Streptomyces sp. NPDC045470]|uniref:MFS transporter n=1 Tax=unclassified Streptomyces TaxID=2593676 RepID=UPI0033FD0F48